MKYLTFDAQGYLACVSDTQTDGTPVENLDGIDLSGARIGAYRWDGAGLVLDETKLAALLSQKAAEQAQEKIGALQDQLDGTDGAVLEALEALFSATTLTGFLAALIGGAKKLKDVLTARTAIREKIKKLEISL
jgi:hypothetical protein